MLTLLLVCAFFSTQVQKYLAWAWIAVQLYFDPVKVIFAMQVIFWLLPKLYFGFPPK